MKKILNLVTVAIWSICCIVTTVYAGSAPTNGPTATSAFGVNPIYSPGIKPTMIVDELGALDSTLTQQQQDEYTQKISEWAAAGIEYGAYYNMMVIESDLRYTLSTGAQVNPDGSSITGNDGQIFYQMSPTRQAFKDYLIDSGKLAIDMGAIHIFLDVASIDYRTMSFDDEVVAAFATYIGEPAYDIRTLVTGAGYNTNNSINVDDAALTGSSYWQQWIAYDKVIEREFFTAWSTTLKNYATALGKTVVLSANRYIDEGEPADSWVTGDILDYTLAETFLDTLGYPEANLNFAYKTSIAYGKRFWSWNFPNNSDYLDDGSSNGSDNQPTNNADRLFIAETFANGGLSQVAGANWVNYIAHDIKPIVTVKDYAFVNNFSELFNLNEAGDTALLYGEFAVNNDPGGLGKSFKGASYLLSDAHRMWDIVFAADENRAGYVSDLLTLSALSNYKTIVIPHVQQLSNAQVTVLEDFLNADAANTIIGFSSIATHTETNANSDGARTFDDLFGVDATDTATYTGTVISIANDLGKLTADAPADQTIRANNVTSFVTATAPSNGGEISTDLPQTLHITRFADDSDGSHIYHLVNTDYTIATDTINSVVSGKTLTMPVPENFSSEPVISIITPDGTTITTLTATTSGNNRTVTLPTLGVWSIIKVGSAIATPTSIDYTPWSQIHLRNSAFSALDDAFDMNGNRPDTMDASGNILFDYWYWKGGTGSDNPVPYDIAYLATDDVGVSQVELFYRYSADNNTWTNWASTGVDNTLSGTNGIGLFTIASATNGDGYYQFYTQASDTNSQLEKIIAGPETGYGIDTVPPTAPPTFTENNGAAYGIWQTSVAQPIFSWTMPIDILSGTKEGWINIENIANGSTLASCTIANLQTTSSIDPASCTSPLAALGNGRYRVKFRSKDAATNSSANFDIFELRIGTKIVQDPQNVQTTANDGSISITWDAPADTTNFDEVHVHVSPISEPETLWATTQNLTITNPTIDNSITVTGLVNNTEYRVAIESFYRTGDGTPGDFIVLSSTATPFINYGITLTETDNSTSVTEGGATDTWNITLNSAPSDDVIINIITDSQISPDKTSITFTTLNWNVAQIISISAVDDSAYENTLSSVASFSITSNDANYAAKTITDISVSVIDDDPQDTSTYLLEIIESSNSTTVQEGGTTDTYTAVLSSTPSEDVNVSISTDSQVSVNPQTLTFTSSNWDTVQTVTVTAIDDSVYENNLTSLIRHTISSNDTNYNAVNTTDISVTVTDDDTSDAPTYSVIITGPSNTTALQEGGETNQYSILLSSAPSDNVTLTVTTDDQVTATPQTLTFTTNNWETAQIITVTAVNDSNVESTTLSDITFSISSNDTNYNALSLDDISIPITDDDDETDINITNDSQDSGSTGGCTIARVGKNAPIDPTLPLLLLVALFFLKINNARRKVTTHHTEK